MCIASKRFMETKTRNKTRNSCWKSLRDVSVMLLLGLNFET